MGRKKVTKAEAGELSVYVGSGCELTGELAFSGTARIDGKFTGEINGSGRLIVGPEAEVEAQISAAAVVISGKVVGDVRATDRIELRAPGRLKGNISAPLVVMDEGVLFEGHCRMPGAEGDFAPEARFRVLAARQ